MVKRRVRSKNIRELPYGSDPLRAAIARRVRFVLNKRHQTCDDMAEQITMDPAHLELLCRGKGSINQEVCRRLLAWLKGQRIEEPMPSEKPPTPKQGWRKVICYLEPGLAQKGVLKAAELKLTLNQLLHLALVRLLEDQGGWAVIQEASDQLARARLAQELQEMPEARQILKFDLPIAVDLGMIVANQKPEEPLKKVLPSEELREELLDYSINREEEASEWEQA